MHLSMGLLVQILLARADQDYPRDNPPPLRFIRSCSSALAASTLHKVEAAFKAPVLEVRLASHGATVQLQLCSIASWGQVMCFVV